MPILSQNEILIFNQQGYLLIPHVYDISAMQHARTQFERLFNENKAKSKYDSPSLLTDIYSLNLGLENVVFNAKYIQIAKDLLGDEATFIPECAIHRGRYIDWHTDTTVQERSNEISHKTSDSPAILQFATYFQANNEHGGGLTVIPKTHLLADPFLHFYSSNPLRRGWNKLLKLLHISIFDRLERHPHKIDLPIQLGDLLVFDVRIYHRATFKKKSSNIEKYAIFNTFIQPNKAGLAYFNFMKQRPEPYYQYFRNLPLPDVIYQKAKSLNINLLY
jgi:ectoine hydroxylase-related dioxygenase (phytanoyl-CoA dioxygenase family)